MPEIAEVWKPIPGFENSYAASSHGRVRSLDRIVTARNQWTVFPRRWPGQILTPTMTPNGYLLVQLYEDGAKAWAQSHDPICSHRACCQNCADRRDQARR